MACEEARLEQNAQPKRALSFGERIFARSGILVRGIGVAAVCGVWIRVVCRVHVNGWGSVVWLAAMTSLNVIRHPFLHTSKLQTVSYSRRQATERLLLSVNAMGCFVAPCIHLLTGVFNFANHKQPSWMTLMGLLGAVPSLWLFWASHVDLGRNWSPTTEIISKHSLVTKGIYKHVRHPMYSSLWLMYGMCPLLLQNYIVGWSPMCAFGVLYFIRIPSEEQMMLEEFGDEYKEYCARTGRLWPLLSQQSAPKMTASDKGKEE